MSAAESKEPSRRRIVVEILVYAVLVLVVGGLFVGLRVMRDGPRVLTHAPHVPR